ncbi:acetyl-coa acetyltransferase [Anaeramoeba flamelloides]|uniref:acetyl-CoA C-acetyltransferase n=1 Tax=Anaeramoeba flamelloides TaxID=1746091 RepID=A0ABQ8XU32_9EUKA|nr:acetyl-coa acetyltransferase [Anaeramoeba flamelloides]
MFSLTSKNNSLVRIPKGVSRFNTFSNVYIASAVRTPIGAFGGSLSKLSCVDLASAVMKEAISRTNIPKDQVDEVCFGHVLTAGAGQCPVRQATIKSGIPKSVPCTGVNKVCSSGLKAVHYGSQSIQLNQSDVVLCGGTESMSNVPYYIEKARFSGMKFGDKKLIDGMIKDGLWDSFNDFHMGFAGDLCAQNEKISRQELDDFAASSYKKAIKAQKEGLFDNEIVPLIIKGRRGKETIVSMDEEPGRFNEKKLRALKPAFNRKTGSCTAGNSSSLNDGAAGLLLVNEKTLKKYSLKPLARILEFADFAHEPEKFTTAPTGAIKKLLKKARLTIEDIDSWEINEAFSVVSLAVANQLKIPLESINQFGGAVAMGHPIGCSGARILVTLLSVLNHTGGKRGVAAICNGGGGASSVLIERL